MRNLILLGLFFSLLSSCDKDDANFPKENQNEYFPLEVGNYWIYQHYEIDTDNSVKEIIQKDSVIVVDKVSLNKNQYYILENIKILNDSETKTTEYLRDSSGYIVRGDGAILFSENNFTDTLFKRVEVYNQDTLFTLTYRMESHAESVEVPAGTFDVLNYRGTVITSKDTPGLENPRYNNTYFAKGVGKVSEGYFYLSAPLFYEKRLIRYHVSSSD